MGAILKKATRMKGGLLKYLWRKTNKSNYTLTLILKWIEYFCECIKLVRAISCWCLIKIYLGQD